MDEQPSTKFRNARAVFGAFRDPVTLPLVSMNGMVSTIIPVYNRPEMLLEAVESVVGQHYRPIEIVVVDDGSTDHTPRVISCLRDRYPDMLHAVRIRNAGPGAAREAGRKVARGEFVQYLDSDDVLYPCKFSVQVVALNDNPDADIAYGRTVYRRGESVSETSPGKRSNERMSSLFPALLVSRWWSTATPLYRASIGVPWSRLRQEEDWEYESRLAIPFPKLAFVDEAVAEIRHHASHRASGADLGKRERLANRARARLLIYKHAREAGIDDATPEMQHFGRSAFHLGRQCAEAGLADEAALLLHLARRIGSGVRRWQPAIFLTAGALLGWKRAGRWASRLEQWKN